MQLTKKLLILTLICAALVFVIDYTDGDTQTFLEIFSVESLRENFIITGIFVATSSLILFWRGYLTRTQNTH